MPLHQQAMTGIDIGSSQIKIAQLNRRGEVVKWAISDTPDGVIKQGRIIAKEPLIKVIKKLVREKRIRRSKCSLCLSSSDIIIRELRLPPMTEHQIQENVYYEISEYLPVNIQRYSIEYKVLEVIKNHESTVLRVMVLAVPKNIISTYMEVLAGAGLKLKYIDVDVNALSKLIKKSIYSHLSNSSETASCLIDFGSATTKVTVFQNAIYCIHKTIPKGSAQITDIITNQMQTDFSTAEEIKMQKNFIDFPGKKWNNKDVISFLNELTAEIFRVIQYYNNNNRFNNIDHIYLLGGGAHLKGLSKFLEEHLGIKVSIIDDLMPFSMIPPASSKKLKIPFTTLSYAIAVTLREEP